jgi:hypothetical protein
VSNCTPDTVLGPATGDQGYSSVQAKHCGVDGVPIVFNRDD